LIEDWLGLAGYLAEAVGAGDVAVDVARAELAAAVDGVIERRALGGAAEVAAVRLGDDALITTYRRRGVVARDGSRSPFATPPGPQ
jgi:hypothetical protein